MSGFGGSVKLTGEAAYRQALQAIAADLKNVAAQQKLTAASYDKSDTSITALSKRSDELKNKLAAQQKQYDTLSKALKDYTSQQEKAQSVIQKVQAQYDKEKAKLEQIASTYGKQSQEYKKQAQVVDELETQLKELNAQYEKNETTIKKTQAALTSSEADIRKTKTQMQDLGEKAAKAGQDAGELGLAVENSGKQAKDAANDGYTVFKNVLANLATQAISKAIEGAKRLGTAIVEVGKQSLASYAEYEQLVGGVETLFKDSANTVQDYAAIAYKTAGMSANEYMSTVTSFSASLLQGLGGDTAKAAKIADMAIIDMSDNANKMGTNIGMIQNAYQGFAKQNFTMLDNLKLGYGGTASEMARLVNETGVMGDAFKATAQNVKEVPFDKMIEAIHKVQENMGITGTTALEASETIEGSVNSMKASWRNLLTAIADNNADLGKSVNEFVNSTITAGNNIIPRIRQIVDGIKKLFNGLTSDVLPKLKKEIPEIAGIIEPFEWILNNKESILTALKLIVAGFATAKIISFAQSLSGVVTTLAGVAKGTLVYSTALGGLTAAQTANTTATTLGTVAVNLFNAAWKANPIGLVVTGLTLLAGGIIAATSALENNNSEQAKHKKHLKELQEEIESSTDSWKDLQKAQQESLNTGMTEVTHYRAMKSELDGLIDKNGKVKEGYEERAKFLTTELANALGIEISMTDGVVQGYEKISSSIDTLIEKKKAEIILESQQEAYTKAINNRAEAYKNYAEIKTEYDKQIEKVEAKIREARRKSTLDEEALASLRNFYMKKYVGDLQGQYDQAAELLSEYTYTVSTYENNMAAFHNEKWDEIKAANWELQKDYQSTGDAQKAELQANIDFEKGYSDFLIQNRESLGEEIYNTEYKASQERLKLHESDMKKYVESTTNNLKDNGKAWVENAATVLSKLTGNNIEFRKAGDGNVQMFIDGIAQGEPMAESKAEEIIRGVLKEFDEKAAAEGAGKDTITGFTNGVGNFSLQNTAFRIATNFGSSILQKIKSSLGIGSPSKYTKQYGRWLLQGLGIGMENEEKTIIDEAQAFGDTLMNTLSGALEQGVSTKALSALQTAIPSEFSADISANTSRMAEAAQSENMSLIGQFKQALSQMKIEMDDITMGQFVDNTVTKLVYN